MIKNLDSFLQTAPTVALAYVTTISSKHYIKTDFSKKLSELVDVQEPFSGNQEDCIQRVFDKYKIAINDYLKEGNREYREDFTSLRALFTVADRLRHGNEFMIEMGSSFLEYMHNQGYHFTNKESSKNNSKQTIDIQDLI
jgi:hypothetical protein